MEKVEIIANLKTGKEVVDYISLEDFKNVAEMNKEANRLKLEYEIAFKCPIELFARNVE